MTELLNLLLPWREATDQIADVFVYIIGVAFLLLSVYFLVKTFFQRRLISGLTKEVGKYGATAKPRHLHELQEILPIRGI